MFKFLVPTILIGVTIAVFLMFITPQYQEIGLLREQVASYDEALENSKALQNERDKLTKKYNSINPDSLEKLSKMLPSNVDNIRLILEIEKIAGPYNMILRDVKYETLREETAPSDPNQAGIVTQDPTMTATENPNYGSWDLEFSTQGSYENFINFIKALESNLRIVDISSIEFSSEAETTANVGYRYSFKIKTYWLKD